MEKIAIGFLGCGNIGSGVYRLIGERGGEIARNEGVSFTVKRALVRSLAKKRACDVPQEILTDRPEDVPDDPQIGIVMEFMGGA